MTETLYTSQIVLSTDPDKKKGYIVKGGRKILVTLRFGNTCWYMTLRKGEGQKDGEHFTEEEKALTSKALAHLLEGKVVPV